METILLTILIVVLVNIAFYIPLYIRVLNTIRHRYLQAARTELTRCATEFQKYLVNEDINSGQFAHDILYEVINNVQYFDKYLTPKVHWGKRKKTIQTTTISIEGEVNTLSPEINKLFLRFIKYYIVAAFCRHPITFIAIALCLGGKLLLDKSCSGVFGSLSVKNVFQKVSITMAIWIIAVGITTFAGVSSMDVSPKSAITAQV